jgi:methionyl-tRNA formyltransferase
MGGAFLKAVFMGTPDFAVPSLTKMIGDPEIEIVGVVTQPDRPRGRGNKMTPSPVKRLALDCGLDLFQPESINTPQSYSKVAEWDPEVIVVVAFGQILKPHILELPPLECINVHASLLPRYRGAAPIHWAVINGERKTGVTTMYMDQGMDTGDIILQEELAIGELETTGEVHDRLARLGADVLLRTLHLIREGQAPRSPQDDSKASYAPLLTREHEVIDWGLSAAQIVNHIRGLNPWPGSFTTWKGKTIKLWRAHVWDNGKNAARGLAGQVVIAGKEGIIVQTGKGLIAITELQMQNRSRLDAESFLRGNSMKPGEILGGVSPNDEKQG